MLIVVVALLLVVFPAIRIARVFDYHSQSTGEICSIFLDTAIIVFGIGGLIGLAK